NVGPRSQRPRLLTRRFRLPPSLGERLDRQRRLDVVVERRRIAGRIPVFLSRVPDVREHRFRRLARDGTIPATNTSSVARIRSHTIGATCPANDCATTTRLSRSPIASTTTSA